jgi:hypothetical protein
MQQQDILLSLTSLSKIIGKLWFSLNNRTLLPDR